MSQGEGFLRAAMETHGPAVYRLALCRLQCVEDAEDVYQEVFLRLLRENTEEWTGEHAKAWLLRTTMHRCTDVARFRLRRPVLPLEEVPELAQPEEETAGELWEAVARLPEKYRTAVHLFYGEGYQTEEIAALLGCPAATIRSRLARARRQLKNLMGGLQHEEEQLWKTDGTYPRASGLE